MLPPQRVLRNVRMGKYVDVRSTPPHAVDARPRVTTRDGSQHCSNVRTKDLRNAECQWMRYSVVPRTGCNFMSSPGRIVQRTAVAKRECAPCRRWCTRAAAGPIQLHWRGSSRCSNAKNQTVRMAWIGVNVCPGRDAISCPAQDREGATVLLPCQANYHRHGSSCCSNARNHQMVSLWM